MRFPQDILIFSFLTRTRNNFGELLDRQFLDSQPFPAARGKTTLHSALDVRDARASSGASLRRSGSVRRASNAEPLHPFPLLLLSATAPAAPAKTSAGSGTGSGTSAALRDEDVPSFQARIQKAQNPKSQKHWKSWGEEGMRRRRACTGTLAHYEQTVRERVRVAGPRRRTRGGRRRRA